MLKPHLFLKPSRETTRLYLTIGSRELLRAVLPPPGPYFQTRTAPLLLEALSLWLQRPLSVVLCAADGEDSSALGLSDGFGFGFGRQTEHYDVEVVDPAQRLRGLGSFADLRRLQLRGVR